MSRYRFDKISAVRQIFDALGKTDVQGIQEKCPNFLFARHHKAQKLMRDFSMLMQPYYPIQYVFRPVKNGQSELDLVTGGQVCGVARCHAENTGDGGVFRDARGTT